MIKEGDWVYFAKLVWRGRAVLFKGRVIRTTDKTLIVNKLETNETHILKRLYSYNEEKGLRVCRSKAMRTED